jgi:hypothetical protein
MADKPKKATVQALQTFFAPVLAMKAFNVMNQMLDSPDREEQVNGVNMVSKFQKVLMPPLAPEKVQNMGSIPATLIADMEARIGRKLTVQIEHTEEDSNENYLLAPTVQPLPQAPTASEGDVPGTRRGKGRTVVGDRKVPKRERNSRGNAERADTSLDDVFGDES